MNRDEGQYFFHTFLMNCFLKNPQKGEIKLATPDFPQAEVQPVWVVAAHSGHARDFAWYRGQRPSPARVNKM